jgi:hypothetical protein
LLRFVRPLRSLVGLTAPSSTQRGNSSSSSYLAMVVRETPKIAPISPTDRNRCIAFLLLQRTPG